MRPGGSAACRANGVAFTGLPGSACKQASYGARLGRSAACRDSARKEASCPRMANPGGNDTARHPAAIFGLISLVYPTICFFYISVV
jgi:hypothetical protein